MSSGIGRALRTRLYIDGYNLYYGCLKHTPYKWLDVRALVQRILPSVLYEQGGVPFTYNFRNPTVKYFTASILSSFAKSEDSVACQSEYHTALRVHLGNDLQIIGPEASRVLSR
jgi:6-hydroxy-3-succinoylpyridine 3-monooxygenase